MSKTFVIVIAINEYPSLPCPTLKGAINDAHHWVHFVRHGLEVPREQVRVLTHPPIETTVDAVSVGEATLAGARAAVDEMIAWMRDGGTGLILFSGHGAHLPGTGGKPELADFAGDRLALLLSDARILPGITGGAVLAGAIVFSELDAVLVNAGVANRVTVVVDACYQTALLATRFDTSCIQAPAPAGGPFVTRLLLGAGLGSAAYEGRIGHEWRGAYSYALSTLLWQWRARWVDDVKVVLASHRDLTFRAREILAVLGYDDQAPELAGGSGISTIPFNAPVHAEVKVDAYPKGARHQRELGAETGSLGVYSFDLVGDSGVTLAIARCVVNQTGAAVTLSVNNTSTSVPAGKELWYLQTTGGTIPNNRKLALGWQELTPPPAPSASLTFPAGLTHGDPASAGTTWPAVHNPEGTWYGPFGTRWVGVEVGADGKLLGLAFLTDTNPNGAPVPIPPGTNAAKTPPADGFLARVK